MAGAGIIIQRMPERRVGGYNRADNKIDPRDFEPVSLPEVAEPLKKPVAPKKTIEIAEVIDQIKTEQQALGRLRESVTKMTDPDNSMARLVSRLMFGSKEREVKGEDGLTEMRPWTLADIFELDRQGYPERERGARRSLTQETVIGLREQQEFFTTAEHPRLAEVEAVIDFTTAIAKRVLASEKSITEPFTIYASATYDEAEMMEIIRRTILEPTYMLMEGHAEGPIGVIPSYDEDDEFWDPMSERDQKVSSQMKDPRDYTERREVQKRIALNNPKGYDSEKWEEILDKEAIYLYQYALVAAGRDSGALQRAAKFYASLTDNGQPVHSNEQLAPLNVRVEELTRIYEEIKGLEGFRQLSGWIKQRFGPEATFQTLLQTLSPVDLNHQPEFNTVI